LARKKILMRFGSLAVSAVTLSPCLSGVGCVTADPDHHESAEHYAYATPPVQSEHHGGQDEHEQKEQQQYEQHQ
jgi:hypothetical protein